MHELSITQSVVDAVVTKLPDRRISLVSLEIGKLSGIEPDALRFCFELVTAGTPLDGAELRIAEPAGLAHCAACEADFEPESCILLCPCGSADVRLTSGDQLTIRSVMVA